MSTDPMMASAADAAHAALTGQLGPELFDVHGYLGALARERPDAEQAAWLLGVATSAVYSHSGTLQALQTAGVATEAEVAAILADAALRRARRNSAPNEGDPDHDRT